jgi:hypothetical protein
MVINFRACKINRDMYKLARTPILIKKKNLVRISSKVKFRVKRFDFFSLYPGRVGGDLKSR